jgi:hypothetical protein
VPDQHMSYIARCKCGCGGIVFATVDKPKYAEDNAEEIRRQIQDGYSIERVTVEYVRRAPFGCYRKKPAQAGMGVLFHA